jgi:D-sedoheptulose 7-phosphate isomerase
MMIGFKSYVEDVRSSLESMRVTDGSGFKIDVEDGLNRWCEITHKVRHENKTVYFIGNGASAMMASHMAADASKNGDFRSLAFNDPALLTAVSNDISYAECFVIPMKRFCNSEDVLVTISSSGNSPNR